MAWTENPKLDAIRQIMEEMAPRDCHNVTEFHMAYEWVERANLTNVPMTQLISDESFGARRLGIMGHNLQVVPVGVYTTYLEPLEDDLVQDVCGDVNITTVVANQHVFVVNFNAMAQYTDKAKKATKYAPSVIGFFCLNDVRQQFLPLAITFNETKRMYTKNDTVEDWTLAKMVLDATELNHLQMQHFVEVPKVMVPIQVEMIRAMAPSYPLHAFLQYHFAANFAIENSSVATMFSENSTFDKTFAFEASGALRFMRRTSEYRIDEDFHAKMQRKGLIDMPHRIARCGLVYYDAIEDFVGSYLEAFYASEAEIQNDPELQTEVCQLRKFEEHLVEPGVPEHRETPYDARSMTWHGIAAPYVTPALWNKPLPTAKDTRVDLLDYAMPPELLPKLAYFAASAARPVPPHFSMLHAYNVEPFANETKLGAPIARFQEAMRLMENWEDREDTHNQFDGHVRPSKVPVFSYT